MNGDRPAITRRQDAVNSAAATRTMRGRGNRLIITRESCSAPVTVPDLQTIMRPIPVALEDGEPRSLLALRSAVAAALDHENTTIAEALTDRGRVMGVSGHVGKGRDKRPVSFRALLRLACDGRPTRRNGCPLATEYTVIVHRSTGDEPCGRDIEQRAHGD